MSKKLSSWFWNEKLSKYYSNQINIYLRWLIEYVFYEKKCNLISFDYSNHRKAIFYLLMKRIDTLILRHRLALSTHRKILGKKLRWGV